MNFNLLNMKTVTRFTPPVRHRPVTPLLAGWFVFTAALFLGVADANAAGVTNSIYSGVNCPADSGLPEWLSGTVWRSGSETETGMTWFGITNNTGYCVDGAAMQSGSLFSGGTSSFIEVTVTNAVAIEFTWRSLSSGAGTFLAVVNLGAANSQQMTLPAAADTGWQRARFQFSDTGTNTLRWRFTKGSSTADYALLDAVNVDYGTRATPAVVTQMSLNPAAQLPFRYLRGTFFTTNQFGASVVQSQPILDTQCVGVSLVDVPGNTTVNWSWAAQVEGQGQYDYGSFWVDGVRLYTVGDVMMNYLTNKTYTLPAGRHTLYWVYQKDYSFSSGIDALVLRAMDVQYPAYFVTLPYTTNFVSGTTAYVRANVGGLPSPSLSWQRGGTNMVNDARISGVTTTNLTIANVQMTDQTGYTLLAVNSWDSVSNYPPVTFQISTLPTITSQPLSATLPPGSSTNFAVVATGSPTPTYQWRKNGTDIAGATASSYSLTNITTNDAGNYSVYVWNTAGGVTSAVATLTVNFAPIILQQPVSQTVAVGGSASFSVGASGLPAPSYQWRKNGTDIAGATVSSYALSNITTNDDASYSVLVSNSVGSVASSVATLTVNFAPYIISRTSSLSIGAGATNYISVTAAGKPTPSYSWRRATAPGTPIGGDSDSLYFNGATPSIADNYYCIVTNSVGSVQSPNIPVTVVTAPQFLSQPVSLVATQGYNYIVSCSVMGGVPLSMQWRKDGALVSSTSTFSDHWNAYYYLGSIATSNAGNYTLMLSNSYGVVTSQTATVTVLVSPSITTQPVSLVVTQGYNAILSVAATGTTPLAYQWRKDGVNVSGATYANYLIAGISASQAGAYTVVVSNAAGTTTSIAATVTVRVPAAITVAPVSRTVAVGQNLSFSATAAGDSPLAYQWQFNSVNVAGATNSTLSITNARTTQNGQYKVSVSNAWGTANASASLTVLLAPVIASQPSSVTVREGGSVALQVVASGSPVLQYQWYHWVSYQGPYVYAGPGLTAVSGATNALCTLTNLQRDQFGWYQVRVGNAVGTNFSRLVYVSPAANDYAVTGWGDATFGQSEMPSDWINIVAVAAGGYHTLALTGDGRVLATGDDSAQQCDVPFGLSNVVAIAAGAYHSLALLNDSTVVAWGDNSLGQSTVPAGLSNIVAIAAGTDHSLALTQDSEVVAWGANDAGQCTPATNGFMAISAGNKISLGRRYTHQTRAWGTDLGGDQTLIMAQATSAGNQHGLYLNLDSTVLAAGLNTYGQTNVPAGLTNVTAIAAGGEHSLALKRDGSVVAWGAGDLGVTSVWPEYGQATVPAGLSAVVAITAGAEHSAALSATPPVFLTQPAGQTVLVGATFALSASLRGSQTMSYQWFNNGTAVAGATGTSLSIAAAALTNAGSYTLVASNLAGVCTSSVAVVSVMSPPIILTQPASSAVIQGRPLSLAVSLAGTTPMSLQWMKDGLTIAGANSATLSVAAVTAADAGAYQVIAQNSYGAATSTVAQVAVVLPPQLVASPAGQSVALGIGFALETTVLGTEPLSYRWTQNGVTLPGFTNATLEIGESALTNSGAYQLTVTNLYGAATSQVAQVSVFAPPRLTVTNTPETNRIASGQSLVLSVTNVGTGPFTYSWRLDGDTFATTETPTLVLTNLAVTNAGQYSVVIGNYAGQITVILAQVTVTGPPVITQDPASTIVASGRPVLFTIGVSGEPPLTYQWRKDGVSLADANTNRLALAAAGLGDSGAYDAIVSNGAGGVTSAPAILLVADAPAITVEPVDVTLDVGQDLMLSVAATGTAPLAYQWWQDGDPIAGATTNILNLYGVNVSAAGIYVVTVSNLTGEVVSRDALVVVRAAPLIVTEPASVLLPLGGETTLGVQVFGNQPLTFRWFKDAVAIPGATNSTLAFTNLVAADAGVYSVSVSNEFGVALGDILTLQLTGAPVITSHPENVLVVPGGPAVFRGAAAGLGNLVYQWVKDGAALAGATTTELSIASVGTNDLGGYQLVVANEGGRTVSEVATLAFHGLPSIITAPRNTTIYAGETGELFVEASSTLAVVCEWRRNGVLAGTGTNLVVGTGATNVVEGDVFTVNVTSEVGAVSSKPVQVRVRSRQETIASGGAYITQILRLVPGWNSIYFDVQSDSNTVQQVFGDLPWSSVWSWRDRNRSVQYVQELNEATPDQTDWLVHYRTNRTESFNNNLYRILSHRPYLVHIDGTNAVTLSVTGKAAYRPLTWVPDSFNLTGLPVESGAPSVRMFFGYSTAHYDAAAAQPRAMYELTPEGQWQPLTAETLLKRNTAYWIYCRAASEFNGGFNLRLPYGTALNFAADVSLLTLDFINPRPEPLSVSLWPFSSNTNWPLATKLLNFQGRQYPELQVPYVFDLGGSNSFSVSLVPQRARVVATGFAGVMAASDTRGTLHLVSVEIPRGEASDPLAGPANRSALQNGNSPPPPSPSPYAGLWMGYASLKAVSELNGLLSVTNRVRTTNNLGEVANIVTISYTNNPMTPAPTPVDTDWDARLLVHVDANGQARLLKEVFQLWQDGTTTNAPNGLKQDATPGHYVLVTDRLLLDKFKGATLRDGERVGRRLSSAMFVFDGPDAVLNYVTFDGEFAPGQRVTTSFGLSSTAALNPFRHKYNPHHDNLDASFKVFQQEAPTITRDVTLRFDALPPSKDPAALRNELAGVYSERITGLHRKALATSGDFRIRRISRIAELNPTPTP